MPVSTECAAALLSFRHPSYFAVTCAAVRNCESKTKVFDFANHGRRRHHTSCWGKKIRGRVSNQYKQLLVNVRLCMAIDLS